MNRNTERAPERKQCAVCHAYLFDDDDIVYCPECGAPHHRSCYNELGHCGLEQDHGTPREYDLIHGNAEEHNLPEPVISDRERKAPGTVRCGVCGQEYDDGIPACPNCGAPRFARGGMFGIDMLGGVPADTDIGDGVTADEAKRFVIANTPRYIPRFAAMANGKRNTWNWLAFLLPWAWFASRKMYLYAAVSGIIGAAAELLTLSFTLSLEQSGFSTQQYANFAQLSSAMPKLPIIVVIMTAIGILISLALRIFCGICGDGIYRKYVIAGVKKINAESQDADLDYHRRGGISFLALVTAIFAVQYLPVLIAGFII